VNKPEVGIGGCGCCTERVPVEEVGTLIMPDGKELRLYKDKHGEAYWVDRRLEATLWEEEGE